MIEIDYFIYSSIILSSCVFDMAYSSKNSFHKVNLKYKIDLLFKSLVISSFGKLAVIPLVIWNPPNDDYFNLALLFTYISNSQALSGNFLVLLISVLLKNKLNQTISYSSSRCKSIKSQGLNCYWSSLSLYF